MTDRELLEFAARAAGYAKAEFQDISGWGEVRYGLSEAMYVPEIENYWNPLESDSDAIRLLTQLRMGIKYTYSVLDPSTEMIEVYHSHENDMCQVAISDMDGCPHEVTRRAIVTAAARMGNSRHEQ